MCVGGRQAPLSTIKNRVEGLSLCVCVCVSVCVFVCVFGWA